MTSALFLSSALRNTQISVSVVSLLKFGHTYFTISASTKLYHNSQNNADKVKKPKFDSHSIFENYCNMLTHFRVMNNKAKATLNVPRCSSTHKGVEFVKVSVTSSRGKATPKYVH